MVRNISESQIDAFKEIASIMKVKRAELLQEWYEYDTNAVPACYSLKASDASRASIASALICYGWKWNRVRIFDP